MKKNYADGLLDALVIIAQVSGSLKIDDFNQTTWKMINEIMKQIAAEAAKAYEEELK